METNISTEISEEWRPVPTEYIADLMVGDVSIEASSLGRVRVNGAIVEPIWLEWKRYGTRPGFQPAIEVAPGVAPMLCRLVAEAWVPNPHGSMNVRRHDKDPKNNRPENLYWKLSSQRTKGVTAPDLSSLEEQWVMVAGAPGYEVSSLGHVRKDGRPLKPLSQRGERIVFLYLPNGKVTSRRVKDMVGHAFLLRPMGHAVVSRVTGADPRSDRAADLLWVTGGSSRRSKSRLPVRAKLDPAKVREARQRVAAGETQKTIADSLGVSQAAISLAVRGVNWRGV